MSGLNVNRVIRRRLKAEWDGCPPQQWGDFCVVDGARSSQVYEAATRAGEESACLYEGKLPLVLARAAPYLVRLKQGSHFTRLLYTQGWGDSWGVVIRSPASLAAVRRHLRTLNYVQSSDRRKLLFRFYDPRVLRVFLPTCSRSQLEQMFGPIGAFVMEDEDPSHVLTFHRDEDGSLKERRDELPVANDEPAPAES